MSEIKSTRDDLAALFRDVVLVLGGVFAIRGTDDDTIEQIARGLESTYLRARRAHQQEKQPAGPRLAPHPAIARLLRLTDEQEDR